MDNHCPHPPAPGKYPPGAAPGLQSHDAAAAITNFFQLPRKTLKFQPSIFLHCENSSLWGHFSMKNFDIPLFLPDLTAVFTLFSQNDFFHILKPLGRKGSQRHMDIISSFSWLFERALLNNQRKTTINMCGICDCWSILFWEGFASTLMGFRQLLRPF